MRDLKFDFILAKDKNIIRTFPFTLNEIIDFCGNDTIYEQTSFYLNGKLIDISKNDIENQDDFIVNFDIIAKREFSGFTTNDGEEIYEGDICSQDFPEEKKFFKVIFKDGTFKVKIKHLEFPLSIAIQNAMVHNMSIRKVGNIYENKEFKV